MSAQWGVLCLGCGKLWDVHIGAEFFCHKSYDKPADVFRAGATISELTPCLGCGQSYKAHKRPDAGYSLPCIRPLDPAYPFFTMGPVPVVSKVCPCGITRVDCDYHKP